MDEYSPIPLRKIDGDVDVGRNVAIGGDAIVQGKSHYKGDVRIDGWLDAENIKGPNKGLFTTLEGLKRAYPHPKDGWWAVVSKTLPGPIYVGDKGQWIRAGGETSTDVRLVSVDKTRRADEAEHAKTADVANYANEAGKLSDDSDLINRFVSKEYDDTAKGVITFLKGIIAKAVSYFQGIVNRGDINNNGDITNTGNINNGGDITNAGNIMTKNLTVTGKATFFELEIQKAKAAGGMSVNSAGSFHIDAVEETPDGFVCYQRAEKDGVKLLQTCEVGDQMMCSNGMNSLPLQGRGDQTNDGKPHAIGNHYYWRLATEAPKAVVTHTIDGKEEKCLKLVLSKTDRQKRKNESPQDIGDIPKVGDDLVQIGNRDNKERQSVIMTCAYNSFDGDLKTPYWVQYTGVNTYELSKFKRTWFAANGSNVTGNFKVQSADGGLESIEDYVKGLATEKGKDTVVWQVAFSIRHITDKQGETFRLKVVRIVGDKAEEVDHAAIIAAGADLLVFGDNMGTELRVNPGWDYLTADYSHKRYLMARVVRYGTDITLAQDTIYAKAVDGKPGKDAITYKLIPLAEEAVAYITEDKKKMIYLSLSYNIQKAVGEQVSIVTDLRTEDMTLTAWTNKMETFELEGDEYGLSYSMEYDKMSNDSCVVTLQKGSDIVDQRIVPITFKPKVVFDIDTKNGTLTSRIETAEGKVSLFEQDIKKTQITVGKLDEQYSQLKVKSDEISLTVNNGTRPNLLWGSDLNLDGVDTTNKEAIQKHLGVGIANTKIDSKEWFEYLKGGGISGADAIKFKAMKDTSEFAGLFWEMNAGAARNLQLKPNTLYTLSAWVRTEFDTKAQGYGVFAFEAFKKEKEDSAQRAGKLSFKTASAWFEPINEWTRVSTTFTTEELLYGSVAMWMNGTKPATLYICRPKLEEGNTATPWCAYDGTVEALLESGLDIKEKKFTATADNFVVQNNKGERTFMVDENGKINNGMLSLDGLDAKRAVIKRLRFQSNSVAPYFVTEESMKEFAAYCTRYYAGYGANPLLPFDVAMFFVFLIKPKWLTNIDQGYNRDFSPRSRDIAVSKGMARGFQVDYFSFALELFWHNMVGKTVTIANATNENISFGVKLKTEVLDDMGKKVTQIGGRLDNLPNFPERCVELINLLPGQMASFKYTLFSGAPMNVSVREVHTKGFFLLQNLFDFSYYKKLFEVGYDTKQGFNIFDKKYIDLFNTDKEHVEPKGGFPKKKR